MADEVSPEGGGGSVLKKYGPLMLIVLLAQVVLAWVVITFAFKGNVFQQQPQQEELIESPLEIQRGGGEEVRDRLPYYYSSATLRDITANPAGTNAERFIMFSVQLGLVAYDRSAKPEKQDITDKLGGKAELLAKIGTYDNLIKSIIVQVVRLKTIDQLDGEFIHEVQNEIRDKLNAEVFSRVFARNKDNQIEVKVQEVLFTDIIIQ